MANSKAKAPAKKAIRPSAPVKKKIAGKLPAVQAQKVTAKASVQKPEVKAANAKAPPRDIAKPVKKAVVKSVLKSQALPAKATHDKATLKKTSPVLAKAVNIPPTKKPATKIVASAPVPVQKSAAKPAPTTAAPAVAKIATSAVNTPAAEATPKSEPITKVASKPAGKAANPVRKVINLDEIKLPNGYKPSPNEEYMGPQHLAYFKQKLENWRQELILESQETLEHLRTETRDVGDEAERASRESDNILELRTRDRYRKLLNKIVQALKRIEDGSYGFCDETGEDIGLGRLEARPIATLTVDAQERRELFQRQFRDDH